MSEVPVRELNQNTSGVLARVKRGEEINITERGTIAGRRTLLMIYLATAALVKLIRREPESDALADWLDARAPTPLVTSALAEVELPRALRRTEPALVAAAPA